MAELTLRNGKKIIVKESTAEINMQKNRDYFSLHVVKGIEIVKFDKTDILMMQDD